MKQRKLSLEKTKKSHVVRFQSQQIGRITHIRKLSATEM